MKIRVRSHFIVTQASIEAGVNLAEGGYEVGTVLDVPREVADYLVENGQAVAVDGKEA
jgi:hypothetical protein